MKPSSIRIDENGMLVCTFESEMFERCVQDSASVPVENDHGDTIAILHATGLLREQVLKQHQT